MPEESDFSQRACRLTRRIGTLNRSQGKSAPPLTGSQRRVTADCHNLELAAPQGAASLI